MTILLTGNDLTLDKLWSIAVDNAEVEIAAEADARLEASRKLVYELVDDDVPVYGFNTGVGWNKDHKIAKEFLKTLTVNLFTHTRRIVLRPLREVRAMMAIRLNCLLQGYTGIQPAVARRYADFLNLENPPRRPERGSIGEGDITELSHIGLAMVGEGEVICNGTRMTSRSSARKNGHHACGSRS